MENISERVCRQQLESKTAKERVILNGGGGTAEWRNLNSGFEAD